MPKTPKKLNVFLWDFRHAGQTTDETCKFCCIQIQL